MTTISTPVSFNLYLLSDIHVDTETIYPAKKLLVQKLIALPKNPNDIICLAGDLTDSGTGLASCCCLFPWQCCFNNCGCDNELDQAITEVINPIIKSHVKDNVLICSGNHDEATDDCSYPLVDWIRKNYDNVTTEGFYWKVLNGVMFICLGKYPSLNAVKYFESVHAMNVAKDNLPYIIFFHYQVELSVSTDTVFDFWTLQEKNAFIASLVGKNIICVCHGHIHQTYMYTIGNGVPVFCGSSLTSFYKLSVVNNKITTCVIMT